MGVRYYWAACRAATEIPNTMCASLPPGGELEAATRDAETGLGADTRSPTTIACVRDRFGSISDNGTAGIALRRRISTPATHVPVTSCRLRLKLKDNKCAFDSVRAQAWLFLHQREIVFVFGVYAWPPEGRLNVLRYVMNINSLFCVHRFTNHFLGLYYK